MATYKRIASDGKLIEVTDIPAGLSENSGVKNSIACGAHLLCARVLSGRRILAAAGAGEGAWWSHDVGNVGDRISHSESGCRSADFLRRYRRYAADHAGCRNRWFVHFS